MFGPSLGALIRIGMRLHEQSIRAGGDRGERERRNELARAAARPACALPRLLHAVRRVEDDRRVARVAHAREAAHVDDEIAVAEERAALRDGDVGTSIALMPVSAWRATGALCRRRRACLPGASTGPS